MRTRAAMIPAGALALAVLYVLFLKLRSGESRYFEITPLSTVFALAAGLTISAGVIALLRLREGRLGARFALAAGTLVFAGLAMFSIGLAVLPLGLLLLYFAVRALARRRSAATARAALAGAAIGIGAVAYILVLAQPARAECRVGGGLTSSGGLFDQIGRGSGGGFSMPSGESGGYIDEGDEVVHFSCRDGKLIDFRRVRLAQGDWVVSTQPFPTVGRQVFIFFHVRPAERIELYPGSDGLDFAIICRTCAEPRPEVRGRAFLAGGGSVLQPGGTITYVGRVTFPAAGTWYTTPYDGPIEVR